MRSFIKICLICIIGINWLKEISQKIPEYVLIYSCRASGGITARQRVQFHLTYIPGFSVQIFFQPIYTDYANYAYFDNRSHTNLLTFGMMKNDVLQIIRYKYYT
jgi:hypothetical protein